MTQSTRNLGKSEGVGRRKLIEWCLGQNPSIAFDFGVGQGDFGLALKKEKPEVIIDGCDIFQPSVDYHSDRIGNPYRKVVLGDVVDIMPKLAGYDTFLFGDVLEHIPPVEVVKLLRIASALCRTVLVRIPVGRFTQSAKFGNSHEEHLWSFYPNFWNRLPEWKCLFYQIHSLKPSLYPSFYDLEYHSQYEVNHTYVGSFGLVRS
jgi:hypothetical protein